MVNVFRFVSLTQEYPHLFHPWLGVAPDFGIVFQNRLNQAALFTLFNFSRVQLGRVLKHVAKCGNIALQIDQAIPIARPRSLHHARREQAHLLVELDLGCHDKHASEQFTQRFRERARGSCISFRREYAQFWGVPRFCSVALAASLPGFGEIPR